MSTQKTDFELCQQIAYYIETGNYIKIFGVMCISDDKSWDLSVFIRPKIIGIRSDASESQLFVHDTIVYASRDIYLASPFKFLAINFISKITTVFVLISNQKRITSGAPTWKMKDEFLFKKVIISKNKKNYQEKVPMKEGALVDIDTASKYINTMGLLFELGCLAAVRLANDPLYDEARYRGARRRFGKIEAAEENAVEDHAERRKHKKRESLSILQKLRKFGSALIRIHR